MPTAGARASAGSSSYDVREAAPVSLRARVRRLMARHRERAGRGWAAGQVAAYPNGVELGDRQGDGEVAGRLEDLFMRHSMGTASQKSLGAFLP